MSFPAPDSLEGELVGSAPAEVEVPEVCTSDEAAALAFEVADDTADEMVLAASDAVDEAEAVSSLAEVDCEPAAELVPPIWEAYSEQRF